MKNTIICILFLLPNLLFASGTYIPVQFSSNLDSDDKETMSPLDNFYYRNLYVKKDYNKASHGNNSPVPRLYLDNFSGMSNSHVGLPTFETSRSFYLQDRSMNQTCNIALQFDEIYEFLHNKPVNAPVKNEINNPGGQPTYNYNACDKNDTSSFGEIDFKLSCSPIDINHQSINEMVGSDINNKCYFFRPCQSNSHISILKRCIQKYPKPDEDESDEDDYTERLQRYELCNEKFSLETLVEYGQANPFNAHPFGSSPFSSQLSFVYNNTPNIKVSNFGEYCLYQDVCMNPMNIPQNANTNSTTTKNAPENFVFNFFNQNNRCTHHMNCASGFCLPFNFTAADFIKIKNETGAILDIDFGGVHKFCSPVSACQYNKGLEFYEVPSKGFCANVPREKRDENQQVITPVEYENLVKFELKNLEGESDGYFCSYPSFPLEFVGDISAEVDPDSCTVELVETGFKQNGNQIIETVADEFCIFERSNFVGGIELAAGVNEASCKDQGGSYFEGHEFVHQRYRMLTRLFNALEWMWGEASSKALNDPYFLGYKEGPKIMKVFGELRREIEQDKQYYLAKRKLHQTVLEEKMKTSKEAGDATSIAHDRLMIENELEEASLQLRRAQMFAMLLGFIPKNQIKNRAYFVQNNLKQKTASEINSINSLFDENTAVGRLNKIKLSKEAVVRSSLLPSNNPATLTMMKKKLISDDKLNNCNRIGPSYGKDCQCKGRGDETICGGQCIPENYDNDKYATYYNAMCVNEVMTIEDENGDPEYYLIDGIHPSIFEDNDQSSINKFWKNEGAHS